MIRFAFYTDAHLSGQNPRHRIDDFPAALIAKLREVYSVAEQHGARFMVFGGDFFNNHRIFSYDVIADAMDIVCESPLTTYACVGEHDLHAHNLKSYVSSTLAFFVRRCPSMRILWEPVEACPGIVLYGKHEPDDIQEAMRRKVDKSKVNILVCHELLAQSGNAPFDVIATDTLQGCPYDLVVSGDLHTGYEPHEANGCWFCNPGSMARRTTADADRWPQVAIVDVDKNEIPVIEYVRLKVSKAGDEVFGESIAEVARAAVEFDADDFTKELMEFEAESVDVHELVQRIGRAREPEPVPEPVLRYLASKKPAETAA